MNNKREHIDQLTPELIRQYRAGELPPETRHAVEKYLLENPFEAEALEGLELIPQEEVDLHLEEIHERIDQRVRPSVVEKGATEFWGYTRKLAAVILLLLVASIAYFSLRPSMEPTAMTKELTVNNKAEETEASDTLAKSAATLAPKEQEALNSEPKEEEAVIVPLPEESVEVDVDDKGNVTYKVEVNEDNELQAEELEEVFEAQPTLLQGRVDEIVRATDTSQASSIIGTNSTVRIPFAATPPELAVDPIAAKNEFSSRPVPALRARTDARSLLVPTNQTNNLDQTQIRALNLTITGKVTDAVSGVALTGVAIASGANRKTITDENGFFTIQPDSVNRILSVSYNGYTPRTFNVVSGQNLLKVQLTPSAASLKGITEKLTSTKTSSSFIAPFGITTAQEFETYARQNLRYPEAAKTSGVKGRVVLEFELSDEGTIGELKVVRGLGYGCDEEAIRLLKEGPRWLPKIDKKTGLPKTSKVRVKIRFKP